MKTRTRGFTLLELMLVLIVAGILFGLAIPAMGNFLRSSRMTAAANDMVAALHFARTEAMKRRVAVTVCATETPLADVPNPPTCTDDTEINGKGWIVFVDPNRNGQVDITSFDDVDGDGIRNPGEQDANVDGLPDDDFDGDGVLDAPEAITGAEEIIRRREVLPAAIVGESAAPLRLTFLDTGFAAPGGMQALVLCDSRGNAPSGGELSAARGIVVSVTGRPSVTRDRDEIETLGGCP